jgi:hypothetical protein
MADLAALLRRDHDDLAVALTWMLDPATTERRLRDALDWLRLGLAVHAAAEARVLGELVRLQPLPAVRAIAIRARRDHVAQQDAVDLLACLDVGSSEWYDGVSWLREQLGDHALRCDALPGELCSCVPARLFARLPARFATERMRMFAATSPLSLAAQITADAI